MTDPADRKSLLQKLDPQGRAWLEDQSGHDADHAERLPAMIMFDAAPDAGTVQRLASAGVDIVSPGRIATARVSRGGLEMLLLESSVRFVEASRPMLPEKSSEETPSKE